MRPRGREGIGRAFYCFVVGQRIVILHAFVRGKKGEKRGHFPINVIDSGNKTKIGKMSPFTF